MKKLFIFFAVICLAALSCACGKTEATSGGVVRMSEIEFYGGDFESAQALAPGMQVMDVFEGMALLANDRELTLMDVESGEKTKLATASGPIAAAVIRDGTAIFCCGDYSGLAGVPLSGGEISRINAPAGKIVGVCRAGDGLCVAVYRSHCRGLDIYSVGQETSRLCTWENCIRLLTRCYMKYDGGVLKCALSSGIETLRIEAGG